MTRIGERTFVTLEEVEGYNGQGPGVTSGGRLRFYCPIHGSDRQRSLSVDPGTGWFECFSCGAKGRIEDFAPDDDRARRSGTGHGAPSPPWQPPPEPRPDLERLLPAFQRALGGPYRPDHFAREFIERRGVSLGTALRHGVGFARSAAMPDHPERWPHVGEDGEPRMQSRTGRIVFPLTDPDGRVVNLYGRAVNVAGWDGGHRHAKLPGPQAVFNGAALRMHDRVYVCEGAFDALSLAEVGVEGAVALCGLSVPVWAWLLGVREVVLALDNDDPGKKKAVALARGLALRGKEVHVLPAEAYGGKKDLNEALAAGRLSPDLLQP